MSLYSAEVVPCEVQEVPLSGVVCPDVPETNKERADVPSAGDDVAKSTESAVPLAVDASDVVEGGVSAMDEEERTEENEEQLPQNGEEEQNCGFVAADHDADLESDGAASKRRRLESPARDSTDLKSGGAAMNAAAAVPIEEDGLTKVISANASQTFDGLAESPTQHA
ncbi:hypothetical protein TcG_06418 [Trypanosoma cruzi]|nr:hypothetical protein TcBrA4_0093050 [Trypanosoma cruzi]PBJ71150.1 hypothetical protein BCY84_17488 [Trypanosoma cruzi cruzi]RNF16661.1 hypothetical protein TcG_06418 [Trypanosoma cruzi]